MPIFHPDPPRLPPHLRSEQEVLAALRTLPPECHVFARLAILDPQSNRDREIDFLVIHPELGLVIVEVKGHGVEPNGDHWIRRQPDGRVISMDETPGQQLLEQQYALSRFLRENVQGFLPATTRVLALPALQIKDDQSLGADLPSCRILTRSKLRNPFVSLRNAVTGGAPWATWRATTESRNHEVRHDCMAAITAAVLPGLLPVPVLAEILEEEGRVQDRFSQHLLGHLAQNFCRGRFHVQGGPGSGKSLLARKVARIWAAEGRRVLVVAFNKAITYATQMALDDLQTSNLAGVTTYHDLAINLLDDAKRLPVNEDSEAYYNHALPEELARLLSEPGPPVSEKWDALIIDEAQDLRLEWVRPLLALLNNPTSDPVLILEDPAQSIYRKTRHEIGQPWRLDLSLRQHPAIRWAAREAFPDCGWEVPRVDDPDGVVRRVSSSPASWKRDLGVELGLLAKDGILPHQVMVIAPHRPQTLGIKEGEFFGPWGINTVVDWWDGEKENQVRFSTVYAFKGLEADVVIYLAPGYRHPEAQRLAYTAYSRARHRLIVLERAIAEPARVAPLPAPVGRTSAPSPYPQTLPQIRTFNGEQRGLLMSALTAAKTYRKNT